jgi:hypothetical protein
MLDGQAMPVLRANADLIRQHGLAMAHSEAGHRLLAHWPSQERSASEFGEVLAALGALPASPN